MEGEKRKIRVRGIVIPVEWDAEGNAIKAVISAVNEEEYLIEDNKNSGQFLGLIRQEVDVRGMVREEAGRRIITVERCQRLKQHKIYRCLQK
jgi:hypothetical protein